MIALLAARAALARIPAWAVWTLLGLLVVAGAYLMGRSHESKVAAAAMAAYKAAQVEQAVKIVKGETTVVVKTEIEYRDRIQKIYVQGAQIETRIPEYIQLADDARFSVNAGFLRVIDASWTGEAVGPAEDSDREPAGIPLSEIAAVEVGNATSCRAWREQSLGWRQFYFEQQQVINGAGGTWYRQE